MKNKVPKTSSAYIEKTHRNATSSTPKAFRSLQHYSKVDVHQSLAEDKQAPRITFEEIEESFGSVMNPNSGINDVKQI